MSDFKSKKYRLVVREGAAQLVAKRNALQA
jgi:hypothetical protein